MDANGILDLDKFVSKLQFSIFDQHEEFFCGGDKDEIVKKMRTESVASLVNTSK